VITFILAYLGCGAGLYLGFYSRNPKTLDRIPIDVLIAGLVLAMVLWPITFFKSEK